MDIVDELTDLSGAPANEVKAVADKAIKEIERLREALQELVDWQNGPPLVTYTDGWNKAMEKARAALRVEE
jgi:hypothetical protein